MFFNLVIKIHQRDTKLFTDDVINNSNFSVFRKLSVYGAVSRNLFSRKSNILELK